MMRILDVECIACFQLSDANGNFTPIKAILNLR